MYHLVLTVWLISVGAIFVPQIEALLATKVHRLRLPSEWELRRLGPAWFAVCTAAGVDPDRYRVWVYEGPEATAPVVAGSTVAVSNWSIYTLPPRNLEAVLAHELAHHLALPRLVSLFIYWLSLPARVMGLVIAGGLKHPVLSLPVKLVLGFLTVGVFLVGLFTGFDWYTVLMLSPWTAPLVVPWLARKAEQHADRVAADLGFGVQLVEVFAGREFERARSAWRPERPGLGSSQPLDTARLRTLEKYLKGVPDNSQQPPWPGGHVPV